MLFRVNLRKTTVYTCSFAWPGNTATFDILELIEMIIRKQSWCFAANVLGASTSQHHVGINVMEAKLIVFHGFLN
ncbi:hypothetical protein HID58_094918 [Brassica napus]|uniref:Uncharacterized protein n=1 Tax=Brassica napus TaxID=3708 RepID=A0ABQ7X5V0_BRANA|nr:hypothetical protein HID58_094918 [Brassica napus]